MIAPEPGRPSIEPPVLSPSLEPVERRLLLVSAVTPEALEAKLAELRRFVATTDAPLADVAFTASVGRKAFARRAAVVLDELELRSSTTTDKDFVCKAVVGEQRPLVAMMFPGQGSQCAGMGQQLYEEQPLFRSIVRRCARHLRGKLEVDLVELLYSGSQVGGQGAAARDELLRRTSLAQPALFVVELALAELLMHYGVQPAVLLGHSVGEYVAACIGGVFEPEAALELVAERGRLMQTMPEGAMLAVRKTPEQVRELAGGDLDLAAHNAPELCVVSGPRADVLNFRTAATDRGWVTTELHTSHAFHSRMMDAVLEPFARAVERAQPRPSKVPILSTMTGALLTDEQAQSVDYWTRQLRNPVQFAPAVEALCRNDEHILLEVGPGVTLTSCATQVAANLTSPRAIVETLGPPRQRLPALDGVLRTLGRLWVHGVALDYEAIYFGPARRHVRIPTYAFQRARHWVEAPVAAPEEHARKTPTVPPPSPEVAPKSARKDDPEALRCLLETRLGRTLRAEEWSQSFVQLGFDSLGLSQLVARISENLGMRVSVKELFGALGTPLALESALKERTDGVGAAEPEAVDQEAGEAEAVEREAVGNEAGLLDLRVAVTPPQQEIWLSCKLGGAQASLAYNECRCFRFDGNLDRAALGAALDELVSRHQVLRQTFSEDGQVGLLRQPSRLVLRYLDPRASRTPAEEQLRAAMQWEATTPFDLGSGPLLRGTLIALGGEHSALLLCAHHIIVDGSSWEVLIRELGELYGCRVREEASRLAAAPSFARYARAEARYLRSEEARKDIEYWVSVLSGHDEDLELPLPKQRPKEPRYHATRSDHLLDRELVKKLRGVASRASCTLQTVLLGGFAVLLERFTQQRDLLIGVPAAGQSESKFEGLVGHSVRVLPMRTTVDDGASLDEHLRKVHAAVLDGLQHRRANFAEVLSRSGRRRDPTRPPLVQVAFGMGRSQKRPAFHGLSTRLEVVPRVCEHFELYVYATEHPDGLEVSWSYRTDLFDAECIEHWQRCFVTLLERFCATEVTAPLKDLQVLHAADEEQLLALARGPRVERDNHVPVHRRIAVTANSTPNAIALIDRTGGFTYRELDHRANQWAEWLNARGLEPGSLVAVCLDRTCELVAALLGIWRAGLAYVPLDPAYPAVRVRSILETANAALVVANAAHRASIPGDTSLAIVEELVEELSTLSGMPHEVSAAYLRPTDTAYVIFTSGSTGQPKGVRISQGALENFIVSMSKDPGFDATDVLLAVTTISFDIAGLELFLPLCAGGRLVLATREQAMQPRKLERLLARHQVNVLQATPATWQMLLDAGWQGNRSLRVLCGGESFPRHLAERLLDTCAAVWNLYGPTETTIWSTFKRLRDPDDLGIGRPIDNTNVYVLDEHRRLLPMGVAGELYIGGAGVALGYLARPELTAERFFPSPFEPGDVLYRSGDLARWRSDGELECLGRLDFQVKIRGFRVECGEIENALVGLPGVRTAVVVARETESTERVLVAYLVPETPGALDRNVIGEALRAALPHYMVPSYLCLLDSLPLTPNHKVDRKALPPPEVSTGAAVSAPVSSSEAELLEVWAEVLGHSLGVNDNFYQAGGHSLLALRLVERINARFGSGISLSELLRHPTVRELARLLESGPESRSSGPDSVNRTSSVELNQHRGLFRLRRGTTSQTPMLLIHGDKADGLLLPHLPNVDLFGYQHQGSNGERIRLTTVEALAARCHEELVKQIGDTPCVVAGHSFGALVAYHVSVLRTRAGLVTPRAVLIDARHPSTLRVRRTGLEGLKRALVLAKRASEDEETIEAALERLALGERVPVGERTKYILATYRQASRAYEPPPWDGELEIIRSEEWARKSPHDCWENSARGSIRRVILPVSHLAIVREEDGVAPLGRWLTRILTEVRGSATLAPTRGPSVSRVEPSSDKKTSTWSS